jgi:hypothetical protein
VLFETENDLEILASSIPELSSLGSVDLVLLGSRNGQNLFDTMAGLEASRPDLKIIVTGSVADDETTLKALAAVCTRRRVLSTFMNSGTPPGRSAGRDSISSAGFCNASRSSVRRVALVIRSALAGQDVLSPLVHASSLLMPARAAASTGDLFPAAPSARRACGGCGRHTWPPAGCG